MIEPRTVSVSIEITGTELSIATLRGNIRSAVQETVDGRVRQVAVNVIQGSRKRKASK